MAAAKHLELLVEEPSAEAFFQVLLPRILPQGCSFAVHVHQGKTDLLGKLEARLKAYAKWLPVDWRLLVIVDRDDGHCKQLKQQMEMITQRAKLLTRAQANHPKWQVVNRVAVEELEAWYFGDWDAVRAAFPRVSEKTVQRQGLRDPDAIKGGTWEAFERELQRAGYFKGGLAKIEAARSIAAHIQPERNRSHSFRTWHGAVMESVGWSENSSVLSSAIDG
jgi:hypothetical protein